MKRLINDTMRTVLIAGMLTVTASAGLAADKSAVIHGEPIEAAKRAPAATATNTNSPPAAATANARPADSAPSAVIASGAAPATNAVAPAKNGAGYLDVGFDLLASYEYTAPDIQVTNPPAGPDEGDRFIPDTVKKLDGKKSSIKGFMLPLKVEAGKVTEFLIMRNQAACCYGTPPKITELINVTVNKGVEPIMDSVVSVRGTLRVGTVRENGYIVGVYRMDGEKLVNE